MMNCVKFLIFCLLFVGLNVTNYYGISKEKYNMFLIVLALIPLWKNRFYLFDQQKLKWLLIFVFLFACSKMYYDRSDGTRTICMTIIGAPIVFSCLPDSRVTGDKYSYKVWQYIVKLVFIAFLFHAGFAIYERIIGRTIFGLGGEEMILEDLESYSFRSTGIYGHPLKNALIASTMMSFTLVSPIKIKYKMTLWIIGYMSILCYNTRGSIVGNAMLLSSYIAYTLFMNKYMSTKTKLRLICVSLIVAAFGAFLVFGKGLGGRLLEMGLFDEGSAQVRVNIWDVFDKYSVFDFVLGKDFGFVERLARSVDVQIIENFWLVYLFRCGLIFLIPWVILYFLLLKDMFKNYSIFNKMFVTATFLLLASTNNSLSSGYMTLVYFLILIRAFDPLSIKTYIPEKYLADEDFCDYS